METIEISAAGNHAGGIVLELFSLYVGGADAKAAKDVVAQVVSSCFESFTMLEGEGFFRGMREPVQLVRIATNDVENVLAAAAEIRRRLNPKTRRKSRDRTRRRLRPAPIPCPLARASRKPKLWPWNPVRL